ncbi:regulatory protein GemA [Luteibacter aegosomatis]|uniref:regulatory protein GemA n=1 Tax=Luteibacter aegosomatis TaxID=2911537 RepID=UPI001FF9E03D|nr:regulatory protein GemA [Luteibacter aegosomatis]UPG87005.1 regulatory protein GemA [Luteibacter aegosomatis]
MDEDTYRDLVARVSAEHGRAVRSAADLNGKQRTALIEEMRRLGATKPASKRKPGHYPGKPHNFSGMPEMVTKIEALLADMALPWSYADAIAKQQTGVAKVAWVRQEEQLRAIIAALSVEQEKRVLGHAVDQELKRLGWAPERVVEMLRPLRPNWRRHRESLRLVLAYLAQQDISHG